MLDSYGLLQNLTIFTIDYGYLEVPTPHRCPSYGIELMRHLELLEYDKTMKFNISTESGMERRIDRREV